MPQRHFHFSCYSWINIPSGGSRFTLFHLPPRHHHHHNLALVVEFLRRPLNQNLAHIPKPTQFRCSHILDDTAFRAGNCQFCSLVHRAAGEQDLLFKHTLLEIKAHFFVFTSRLCTQHCRGFTLRRDQLVQVSIASKLCSRWFTTSISEITWCCVFFKV